MISLKTLQMRAHFFLIGLVFVTQSCFAKEPGTADLSGYANKNEMRLLWTVDGWPDDVVGFRIGRRLIWGNSWNSLGGGIFPELSLDRNWSAAGLTQSQAEIYQQKLKEYVAQGFLKGFIDHSSFVKQLQQVGMRSGDRIRLKDDFGLAVVMGFGFIDASYNPAEQYEYGLFGVFSDGTESEVPLDIYKSVLLDYNDKRLQVKLNAIQNGSSIDLNWISDRAMHDQAGILTYNIYRRKNMEDEWVRIVPPFISPREKTEESLVWEYTDEEADVFRRWYYAVAPINKFQVEFENSWIEYIPEEMGAAEVIKLLPINDRHLMPGKAGLSWDTNEDEARSILVNWDFDSCYENDISGFYVLRSNTVTGVETKVGGVQPPQRRRIIDITPPVKTLFSYKLVTVCKDGTGLVSDSCTIYFKGPKRKGPKRPENFKLEFIKDTGDYAVKATWDLPTDDDNFDTYRLFNNRNLERELLENGSKALGVTNSYIWSLKNRKGNRDYTFGIQPVDKKGRRGERVVESIAIPRLKAPAFPAPEGELKADGNILLSWDYPLSEDLIGFKIYMNDEVIAEDLTVSPHVRSWIIDEYPDIYTNRNTTRLSFDVEALFPYCSAKPSISEHVTLLSYRPDRSLPATTSFTAFAHGKYGEEQWVSLEWAEEHDPTISIRIKGYLVTASNESNFLDCEKIKVGLTDLYYYKIPSDWSGKVYFRVAAIGEHHFGGLYIESTISTKSVLWDEKTLSEKKLEDMKKHNKEYPSKDTIR